MNGPVWTRAKEIAEKLPIDVPWSFCVTNYEDDAVFNIYTPRETWYVIRLLLGLGQPEVRFDDTRVGGVAFEEYVIDGLTLSIITPEETDERIGAD